ncbi:MAG: Bcr/CflA family drug resistance efflux transporter [Halobacteriovoraceae bacterium]|nr:Bcr/CflA family drug resistance efflux transporter [Halobacteriovoraceae bacterium]|tara:strand:- start:13924 stop:15141 length:1218 start_codon:yes stop_codon:yes gene_type:complete
MSSTSPKKLNVEFVLLMAFMTSIMALGIDAVLPALSFIEDDLNIDSVVKVQYIVSVIFMGFGLGQLFYGPLSDAIGRKKPVYMGGLVFLIGCAISYLSTNLEVMLVGRFLQGLGAASFRIISMAIIRDEYSGVAMAKTLSIVMTVFILVPVLAPTIGQFILFFGPWRYIFLMLFILSILIMIWFSLRQTETLPIENRKRLSAKFFISATIEIFLNPISFSATFVSGLIFGVMITYISSAQHIFQDIYELGEKFPLFFGSLAFTIGVASLLNSKLLNYFGILRLIKFSLIIMSSSSLIFLVYLNLAGYQVPPLSVLMIYLGVFFFCLGLLFGNLNTLALNPMGHIAGFAASIIGSVQSFVSVAVGILVSTLFQDNFMTLALCFTIVSGLSFLIIKVGEFKNIYSEA